MGLYNRKTTTTLPLICSDPDLVDGETSGLEQPVRVYSDRTRQRHFDGVKHNAPVLEHMLVNRCIQTGRVASFCCYAIETPST